MRVVLSDKAKFDLFRTYRYIDERNPTAADAFIQRIDTNFKNLVRFPFIGRERSSLAPGLRCLVAGLYLIFIHRRFRSDHGCSRDRRAHGCR